MTTTPHSSPPDRPRVAIVGAGVIGLSIGWRLAQAGCQVTVFERGEPGRGASWAAAGMLAAGLEAEPTEQAMVALGRHSQALWPGFAAELEAAAGMAIGYDATGILACAFTRDQAEKLRRMVAFQETLGFTFERLDAAAARRLEPGLAPNLVTAILSRADHQADNRLVVQALAEAFTRAGGTIATGQDVAVDIEAGRAVGIVAGGRRVAADRVIVAAGAWSREVPGIPEGARPPTRPIKGQMLALRMPAGAPLIRHVVWGGSCYLVPRRDGRLVLGATTEERGFDTAVTAGGLLGLLDDAWRTVPAIEELPVIETWAGFRPGSPDDMPILGETPTEGLLVATGHHRHGIQLTPATASLMAEMVLDDRVPDLIRPFALARFSA